MTFARFPKKDDGEFRGISPRMSESIRLKAIGHIPWPVFYRQNPSLDDLSCSRSFPSLCSQNVASWTQLWDRIFRSTNMRSSQMTPDIGFARKIRKSSYDKIRKNGKINLKYAWRIGWDSIPQETIATAALHPFKWCFFYLSVNRKRKPSFFLIAQWKNWWLRSCFERKKPLTLPIYWNQFTVR